MQEDPIMEGVLLILAIIGLMLALSGNSQPTRTTHTTQVVSK